MSEYKELWWKSMRQKHPGKTDEEIRQIMKEYGRRNTGEKSPLKNNSELASQLAKAGASKRWGKE